MASIDDEEEDEENESCRQRQLRYKIWDRSMCEQKCRGTDSLSLNPAVFHLDVTMLVNEKLYLLDQKWNSKKVILSSKHEKGKNWVSTSLSLFHFLTLSSFKNMRIQQYCPPLLASV